jgi:signal transduction histidine kinase
MRKWPFHLPPYGVAVLAVSSALGLTLLLQPLAQTPSPLLLAAVMLGARYGGLGPGLLATLLSALTLEYCFPPPAHTPFTGLADAARLGVFVLVAILIGSLQAARRRAEEALARALDQERQARGEVEAANLHKDHFLKMLGHELRTPLATIENVLQAFRRSTMDAATLVWGRGLLERQVRHISRLLEDLLDVSCIGCGKLQLRRERLDLVSLLQATAEDHREMLEELGLTLQIELPAEPVWLTGDPTRLAQIVSNLLGNASKFTDSGGTVTLRLARTEDDQWVAVTVRDTGVGIDPEMLPRVFVLFSQAERNQDRSHGGLGLGLALVKRLVEMHAGRVNVASDGPGRGAEFTVLLPLLGEPERPLRAWSALEEPAPGVLHTRGSR